MCQDASSTSKGRQQLRYTAPSDELEDREVSDTTDRRSQSITVDQLSSSLISINHCSTPFNIITRTNPQSSLGSCIGFLFDRHGVLIVSLPSGIDVATSDSELLEARKPGSIEFNLQFLTSKSKLPLLLAHECRVVSTSSTRQLCVSGQHARTG